MNIKLAKFQLKTIKLLLESMEVKTRDIILKSPTGSGKTIILTHLWMNISKDILKQFLFG